MARETSSQSLGGSSEITVLMPVRQGFVPCRDTLSYATRLRYVLRAYNGLRKVGLEARLFDTFVGPVESIQTVPGFRWALIDNETRLLLAVSFDRSWEAYIRKIARDAGPLLDLMLCNCEGYEEYSSDLGYPAFAAWVSRYQAPVDFYYSSTPFFTVDDQAYAEDLNDLLHATDKPEDFDLEAVRMRLRPPACKADEVAGHHPEDKVKQGLSAIAAMYRLRDFFPGPPALGGQAPKDQWFLRRATHFLVAGFKPREALAHDPATRELFAHELDWFDGFTEPAPGAPAARPLPAANDVQGDILHPYAQVTHGCMVLGRLPRVHAHAAALLEWLADRVTSDADAGSDGCKLNVALTPAGLLHAGVTAQQFERFPKDFRDGMEARAGLLGDVRENHPENWELPRANLGPLAADARPVALGSIDIVLTVQRSTAAVADDHVYGPHHPLHADVTVLEHAFTRHGGVLLVAEPLRRYRNEAKGIVEHFGFRDGISQPVVRGRGEGMPRDEVALGEFLAGQVNENKDDPGVADPVRDNGSFMVVRKLREYPARLRAAVDGAANASGLAPDVIKGKLLGRKTDGTPLVPHKDLNDFDFAADPRGAACPFQSHIRRVNPRETPNGDPTVPRIARRGLSYGPLLSDPAASDDIDRGLMFIAYCGSIAEQFEVLQRWVSGGNATGLSSAQSDPLLGLPRHGGHRYMRFEEAGAVHRVDLGSRPLVTLRWGLYLFAPSRSALRCLAAQLRAAPARDARPLAEAERVIAQLQGLPTAEQRRFAWKKLLEEDVPERAAVAADVWAAIRALPGGVLRTDYGVLVADPEQVRTVLCDERTYSVRENWTRMRACDVEIYLGMDECPVHLSGAGASAEAWQLDREYTAAVPPGRYRAESQVANAAVHGIDEHDAFVLAHRYASAWLAGPHQPRFNLATYCSEVLGRLCTDWFGVPDDIRMVIGGDAESAPKDTPACPYHFLGPSRYIFPPAPTPFVIAQAMEHGALVRRSVDAFIAVHAQAGTPLQLPGTVSAKLAQAIKDPDLLARLIFALIQGFVGPTYGHFLAAMAAWIRSRDFWRHQQDFLSAPHDGNDVLMRAIKAAVLGRPVPTTVNRTATRAATLGAVNLVPGELVVASILSAANAEQAALAPGAMANVDVIFGGAYGGDARHACPGQGIALGCLRALVQALFEYVPLRDTGLPLTLEPDPTWSPVSPLPAGGAAGG